MMQWELHLAKHCCPAPEAYNAHFSPQDYKMVQISSQWFSTKIFISHNTKNIERS